ncbi:MAG: hypothetical protein KKI15_02660 [Proteobacteria bacterium]|nr:hypothetical protein [Pseudomonadota bacterium]
MIPIAYNNEKVFGDEDEFKDYLLNTCINHKASGRALAFAFIVYDLNNPQISKVLKDQDYWDALNNLSGKYLSVFYFDKPKTRRRNYSPCRNSNMFEYMTSCGTVSTPQTVNEFIRKTFNVQNSLREPFVIFFQTEEDTIIQSFIVELQKEKIESAFLELKKHIENAVESVENVDPQNFGNNETIYSLIENSAQNGQFIRFVKSKLYKPISIITTVGSFIKFFV